MGNSKILVGLIGSGISRSLSPAMHEAEARHHGIRLHYQLIDLAREDVWSAALPQLLDAAAKMGFAGVNITYPCKQAVIPLLDALSDDARAMGAVNTVIFRDGKKFGHNTDGPGWRWAFEHSLAPVDLRQVVLIGAGGAGSAIAHAVMGLSVQKLVIVDTVAERAQKLIADLNRIYGPRTVAGANIEEVLADASGLIHATPTGMEKYPGMPFDPSLLRGTHWVAEVVYFPLETELLRHARALGCKTLDGGVMAVGQAVLAFELFCGVQANAQRMEDHFHSLLSST